MALAQQISALQLLQASDEAGESIGSCMWALAAVTNTAVFVCMRESQMCRYGMSQQGCWFVCVQRYILCEALLRNIHFVVPTCSCLCYGVCSISCGVGLGRLPHCLCCSTAR
jgi:hypothetical protein